MLLDMLLDMANDYIVTLCAIHAVNILILYRTLKPWIIDTKECAHAKIQRSNCQINTIFNASWRLKIGRFLIFADALENMEIIITVSTIT